MQDPNLRYSLTEYGNLPIWHAPNDSYNWRYFFWPQYQRHCFTRRRDFQVTRADGDTEFEARYMVKTHDGVAIHITNRVLFHMPKNTPNAQPYLRSVIDLEAPNNSAYDYLNHAIFMGTLEVPKVNPGEKPYVIIGVYQLF